MEPVWRFDNLPQVLPVFPDQKQKEYFLEFSDLSFIQNVFENVKEEVKNLKHEAEKLKRNIAEITQKLVRIQSEEIRDFKQKLDDISNNMGEMMIRIVNMETEDNHEGNSDLQVFQQEFKCGECDYICSKEITFRKHVQSRSRLAVV